MAKLGTRSAIAGVVVAVLLSSSCAAAVRSDNEWHQLASAASDTEGGADGGGGAEAGLPTGLAYADPEAATGAPDDATTEHDDAAPLPPPRQASADDPDRAVPHIADNDAADWSAYEQALVANLAASGGTKPPAPVLAAFERASLVVCGGEATPRVAAAAEALDDAAERALNVFAPAMCHLAPAAGDGLPGPGVDVGDWKTLIDLRWRAGAGWADLATFEVQARRACIGLGVDAVMAQSSLDQIEALVAHGECALAWNQ